MKSVNKGFPIADEVATATIRNSPAEVARWQRNEPGAWGHLAGQAVLAARRSLGRPLEDAERRAVWAVLWERLSQLRRSPP